MSGPPPRQHFRADRLLPPSFATAVYVDTENLKNAEHAHTVIGTSVKDWPESLPPVHRFYLYAHPNMTGLWRAWSPTLTTGVNCILTATAVLNASAGGSQAYQPANVPVVTVTQRSRRRFARIGPHKKARHACNRAAERPEKACR